MEPHTSASAGASDLPLKATLKDALLWNLSEARLRSRWCCRRSRWSSVEARQVIHLIELIPIEGTICFIVFCTKNKS
jgi:hypothetical protein